MADQKKSPPKPAASPPQAAHEVERAILITHVPGPQGALVKELRGPGLRLCGSFLRSGLHLYPLHNVLYMKLSGA